MSSSGSLRQFVSSVGPIKESVNFFVGDSVDNFASSRMVVLQVLAIVDVVVKKDIHVALVKFLHGSDILELSFVFRGDDPCTHLGKKQLSGNKKCDQNGICNDVNIDVGIS